MEPILTIDNLNSFGGNMLRQGDKSQLKYRLRDIGNKNLAISGKSCEVTMYGRNYTTIVYETTATVSSDNTVSFTINKVLPKGTFYLEFTVGDYIFPTDHREFFEITPSGKGIEANIIEIVGVDAVVRKAVDLINVDPSLIIDEDKLVTDIISNTGIGNIDEYYKAFNDLKPKAEQSITKSDEALTKSQNALNVANGIDAKASNALSLSESADTLSKSVQEQFNQVVIDGDSSVEAAQARVDASGQTNPSLKARLDKEHNEVTTQLAQKANQAFVDAQLSTIVSGAPKGTYTDLAALQSAYPNGAEGIFLVLQNGHWYYWNSTTSAWSDGGVYQGTGIADNAIRPSMLYDPNFIKRESVNRFDKTTALQGYATSPTGKSASANWYTTDYFIPVNPGDVVRANPAYGGTIYSYDSNKSYITNRQPATNNEPISYTIPPIGGFIKFNVFKDNINAFMYTINKPLPDIYEPFVASDVITVDWLDVKNNSITPSKLPPETIAFLQDEIDSQTLTSKWYGKKMITPGTSISFQDGKPYAQGPQQGQIAKGWQTHAKEQLGLASVTNIALSGRPMADGSTNGTGMITGILARTDYNDYDLCVIEEGTNDAKLNIPAGVIKAPGSSDFDRTTFCGSMQMGIEHIKLYNPNITLILFTPLHRSNGGLNSFDSVNSVGLKLSDYRDLIIEIGALYGCKVVDMFAESGISMITLDIDTIDGLHPNDGGYVKQGNTAVIGINNA